VTVTARHHLDELEELGATVGLDGRYDVILELVGGENLTTNLERLAVHGRIAVIGVGAGATAPVDFHLLMRARGRIHASSLRIRSDDEKAEVMRRVGEDVLPLLADGRIKVIVDRTFPLEQVQEAYEEFAAGGKFGKFVLIP
jgi:NADPH:quinone reductase